MRRAVLLFVSLFLLVACNGVPVSLSTPAPTPTPTCEQAAAPYIDQLRALFQEWSDATELAGQTPRMSLPPQVASLQAIRRKAQDLQVSDCAKPAHDHLIKAMDANIQGYLDFLGSKSDGVVSASFLDGATELASFSSSLADLAAKGAGSPAASAVAASAGAASEAVVAAEPQQIEVSADATGQLAYQEELLMLSAGRAAEVSFSNPAPLQHNWVVVTQGDEDAVSTSGAAAGGAVQVGPDVLAASGLLNMGKTEVVKVPALDAGEYSFICTVPGHYAAGMKGTLVIR